MKHIVRRTPLLGSPLFRVYVWLKRVGFKGSEEYWMRRYKTGGDSGAGSYHESAKFKADFINLFVNSHHIGSVIEFGCGDGNQLKLAEYPAYLGFDVSPAAVASCRATFSEDRAKDFKLMRDYDEERAELTLSLDVIYHLVEEGVYHQYMRRLFASSDRFVLIYSTNTEEQERIQLPHVLHRKFTDWVKRNASSWRLVRQLPGVSPEAGISRKAAVPHFFIFEK